MKFAYRLPIGVKLMFGTVHMVVAFGYYTFQAIYPMISIQLSFDALTITRVALLPIVVSLATLVVPVFVENQRRRILAFVGLIVAFPASGLIRWIGNGLFATEGFEELGLFLLGYMFFAPTYALIFVIGWVSVYLADRGVEQGLDWWLVFILSFLMPAPAWLLFPMWLRSRAL